MASGDGLIMALLDPVRSLGIQDTAVPVRLSDNPVQLPEDDSPKISEADREKVQKIVAIWDSLDIRWRDFFTEVMRNFEYIVDNQLTPEVRKTLKTEGRPELIFNFLLSLVNYISGVIAQNKFKMKATPIRQGDELLAELHTVLGEWAMQNCDGDYEIAKAAVTAAIAKIGWLNNYWDPTARGGGKWITRSMDPFSVRMDPDTKQEDMSDCRYIGVQGYYSTEEILKIFSKHISEDVRAKMRKNAKAMEGNAAPGENKPTGWADRVFGGAVQWWDPNKTNRSDGFFGNQAGLDPWMDIRTGIYRVVEFHDRRQVTQAIGYNVYTREVTPIDKEITSDVNKYEELKKQNPHVFYTEQTREEFWITAICPKLLPDQPLLEVPYVVQDAGFQFKPIFWYSFHPDLTRTRGILDNMISLQDYFNQRMMTWLEAVMRGVNPDWVAEKGAIAPEDLPTWQSKARGKVKFFVSKNKPEREVPLESVVHSLSASAEMALEMRKELSGISPNSLGLKESSAESGTLFNQRVQAGMTMLQSAFSHLQRTMEHVYTYCDRNLQYYLTMPRAVRILGEPPQGLNGVELDQSSQGAYWLKVNMKTMEGVLNDVTQGEYDFRPDLTQLGTTAKQAKFQMDMEVFKAMPQEYQFVIAPVILKNYDSPDAKEMMARMEKVLEMKMGLQQQDAQMELLAKQQGLAGNMRQLEAPDPKQMAQEQGNG